MPATKRLPVILWDLVFWLGIAFPLFTGGVWIRQPGLKLEHTQLMVPVILLVLLSFFVDLSKSSGLRAAHFIWNGWKRALERAPTQTMIVSSAAVALVYIIASLRRHWAFQSGAADLGIFTSAIWNLTHGNGYVSSLKDGINLFADHQSPIFYAFAPLFWLYPHAETLLVAQGIVVASGGYALYQLGRQHLGDGHWALPLLPLLYWGYQPLRNANAFDFHPEITLLPLFLYFLFLAQHRMQWCRLLAIPIFILALGAKESAGPVAVGIGLAWILGAAPQYCRKRMQLVAVPVIIGGLAAFIFDLKVVPTFFAENYRYMGDFDHLGGGIKGVLLAPFVHPVVFWRHALFEKARLQFLFESLAPLAFLPLLAPRVFVAAIPGFLMLFLQEGNHRITTGYHYISEPGVGLFWALVVALTLYKNPREPWLLRAKFQIGLVIVVCALAMHGRSEMFRVRFNSASPEERWVRTQVLPQIDPTATVAASGALVPHLASRFWAHHLPKINQPSGKPLDCIVRYETVNNWPLQAYEIEPLNQALKDRYALIFECRALKIYQLNGRNQPCLLSGLSCPQF